MSVQPYARRDSAPSGGEAPTAPPPEAEMLAGIRRALAPPAPSWGGREATWPPAGEELDAPVLLDLEGHPVAGPRRPLVRLRASCKRSGWSLSVGIPQIARRCFDATAAAAALLLLSPLLFLTALLIKLTDVGPVLFWQTRVGRRGREFRFPKFRSMRVDAEKLKASLLAGNDHKDSITFKMKRDPRVTWIGRIIRRMSIDEIPQLWCVIKGEMSLVGPRPPVPEEVVYYRLADRRRLEVTPGLTCLWQVAGRGDLPFSEQIRLDLEYIDRRSLWLDIQILFRTISVVLSGRGAY